MSIERTMKKLIATLSVVFTLSGITTAGLPGSLTQKHVDWNFVQAVGGMKIELVEKRLDVFCNVSGTETITVKPTQVNSGIGVRKVKCSRVGDEIRLSVITGVFENGMPTDCGNVDLTAYPAGEYQVVYVDPDGTTHLFGEVSLP